MDSIDIKKDSDDIYKEVIEHFTVGLSANPDDIANAKIHSLIDDYIEYNTVGILYGDSGSGKSMLTLSICVHLLD